MLRSPTQESIRPLLTTRLLHYREQFPRAEWWGTAVRKPWSRAPCRSTVECWTPWTCGAKTWPAPSPSSVASTHWVRPSVVFCWLRSSIVPLIKFFKKIKSICKTPLETTEVTFGVLAYLVGIGAQSRAEHFERNSVLILKLIMQNTCIIPRLLHYTRTALNTFTNNISNLLPA